MHEMSITRNLVEIVCAEAGRRPVRRVRLEVGRLTAVMPDALRFCFDVASAGTVLAGAVLQIEEIDGEARCEGCGRHFAMPVGGARCGCGALGCKLLRGEELRIVELEWSEVA